MSPLPDQALLKQEYRRILGNLAAPSALRARIDPNDPSTALTPKTKTLEDISNEFGYVVSDAPEKLQFYDPKLIIFTYDSRKKDKAALESILVKGMRKCVFPQGTVLTDTGANTEIKSVTIDAHNKKPYWISKENKTVEMLADLPYFSTWHMIGRHFAIHLHDSQLAGHIDYAHQNFTATPNPQTFLHYAQLEQERLNNILIPAWKKHADAAPLVVVLLPFTAWLTHAGLKKGQHIPNYIDTLVFSPKNSKLPVNL